MRRDVRPRLRHAGPSVLGRATRTDASTSAVTSFMWDADGQFRGTSGPTGGTSYGYDPFGRRIATTDGGGTRRFAFGTSEDPLVEYGSGGTVAATYVFGPG